MKTYFMSCGKVVVGMEYVYVFWELYYMFKHTSIILTAESLQQHLFFAGLPS